MQQPFGKYLMFRNRLEKVWRHISKQAARQGITCYRLYDHDLPEFPLIIENYEGRLYVSEYKRHHHLSEEEHRHWTAECRRIMSEVTGIAEAEIYLKLRQRNDHREKQYEKLSEAKGEAIVHEAGLKFIVNLTDYLDTGLFLDHRITRQMVKAKQRAKGY
jgi:23S rRNA (cytosine1962-C5)-methyltransferase